MFTLPTKLIQLRNNNHLREILDNNQKVILDFSTDWCPPCRVMEGTIANLTFELEGKAIVVKVDPEKFKDIADQYKIKGIPYFVGVVDNIESGRAHGIVPIQQLKNMINE
ncbi:thioredoxin fold domain-containing protein [Flammeovirga yaeyamensis]|uniref:Thioredoxin fold domain-containing protein n=1 Tax=Flammeovirga yaeyamensis TaxID=367791 RepID=A0AAX1N6Z4_9BACT|nr:thioredoxin family protein [Flammeovirga yaeyamensis]MBB3697565.1 thioredoxin 1 [Flammeovirga yaeyamensis]NMF36258.1 thioredoxin family protein [Flammeovirga yaeyamensis]QWG02987.1 thioredoxin fold domain-containing protein [Flammeovirga yaeyamensis]